MYAAMHSLFIYGITKMIKELYYIKKNDEGIEQAKYMEKNAAENL